MRNSFVVIAVLLITNVLSSTTEMTTLNVLSQIRSVFKQTILFSFSKLKLHPLENISMTY